MNSAPLKIVIFALALLVFPDLFSQGSRLMENPGCESFSDPRTTTNLNVGASFQTGFMGGSVFSQSVSPLVRHRVSNRFSLFAGAELSLFQFSSQFSPLFPALGANVGHSSTPLNAFFGGSVFAGGEYRASDRLSLFGSTWVNYHNAPTLFSAGNLEGISNISKGISMNMQYRVSSSFTIGAGVSFSERANPFMMQSGFGNSRNPFMFWPGW